MKTLLALLLLIPSLIWGSNEVNGWKIIKQKDSFTDENLYAISKNSNKNEKLVFIYEDNFQMRISSSFRKGNPYINFNDHICEDINESLIGEFRVDDNDFYQFKGMDVSADNSSIFIPSHTIDGDLLIKEILNGTKLIVRIKDYVCGQTFTANFDISGMIDAQESITNKFESKNQFEKKIDYYSKCVDVDVKSFKAKQNTEGEQVKSKIKFSNNCQQDIDGGFGIYTVLDGFQLAGTADFFLIKSGESKTLKFEYMLNNFHIGYDTSYQDPNLERMEFIMSNYEYILTVYERAKDIKYPFYKIKE